MDKRIALLFSGGLDSFVAYSYLRHWERDKKGKGQVEVVPVFIDYGGQYCQKELKVAKKLLPNTMVIKDEFNLGYLESGEKAFLPNRNVYLLTRATGVADTVMMGGLMDDDVGDKSPEFCQAMSKMLTLSLRRQIIVSSPFWDMEKVDVIGWYISHVGKSKARKKLLNTVSCYDMELNYCGKCPSCFRKACALFWWNIYLPFYNNDLAYSYLANHTKYPQKRQLSIIKYCKEIGVEV